MNKSCLVCNARGLAIKNCKTDLTSEYETLPQSGKKLVDTINEMLDKTIEVSATDVMCKACYQKCVNYDNLKSKLNVIKFDFADNYNTTQKTKKHTEIPLKTPKKRLVVPASKLQPLPANYQLNFSKLAMSVAGNVTKEQKLEDNKKQQIKISTPNIKLEMPESSEATVSAVENNDITKWTIASLPKDIFSCNLSENQINDGGNGKHWNSDDELDNNDENGMEIDEDCNVTVVTATSKDGDSIYNSKNIKIESVENSELIVSDFNDLQTLEGVDSENYVLGKIRILNSDEIEGPHTIVVDGDNASILEMMSGQRLVYENGEISFVMEDDENKDNEEDSNDDESQIELQVSGDEETANAIIAAAQEKGGAFIKVESGEMYRVQSVKSKNTNTEEPFPNVMQIVAKEGKEFKCLLCEKSKDSGNASGGKEFKSDAEGIMKHLKNEHSATLYVCQMCGCIMRKRTDYSSHLANHAKKISEESNISISSLTKSKVHECDICKRSYSSKTLLQEHMNTHTGTKPYSCSVCMKAFASKYTHQAHLKTHQARPRPYVCVQCGKSFLSQQNLSQHEKIHSGIKNFVCKICGKAFGTQHNLEVHGVVHSGEKNHECDTCRKSFARRAELLDHIRTHTGERPFGCEICGARFTQRSNLHSHRRATHFDDRRYACDQCSKRFKRRRLLEYHIKASHTGERPLRCATCHATFVYPEHYKKHIKIHTGEKTYSCEICNKSFNSRDNRNTHRFVHSDKKPYECLACGASYMRKRLLIAHMTVSGHLAESIVVNQPRVTSVNEEGVATVMLLNDNDFENKKSKESILKTSSQLKPLKEDKMISKRIIEKSEEDEAPKYIITTDDLKVDSDDAFIQTLSASQLVSGDCNTLSESDSGEAVLRLIQVKLPDGEDGWVAIND